VAGYGTSTVFNRQASSGTEDGITVRLITSACRFAAILKEIADFFTRADII
jgi:hypothetical protein